MTIQTQVIWQVPLDQAVVDQLLAKGDEMQLDGKEIGTFISNAQSSGGQATYTRTWVDEAAASEWITFVDQFNPVSATIITS
jgi:hypothetical protein